MTQRSKVEMNQTRSNGRGGARKGAGRKPGSANKKTREIADKAAAEGTTPLEIMLRTMKAFADEAEANKTDRDAHLKLMAAASSVAKDAAPYVHPRLQAIEHTGRNGGPLAFEDILLTALAAGDVTGD